MCDDDHYSGHDKLDPNWLAIELAAVEKEVAAWPIGIRESYESHFPAALKDQAQ